MNLKTTLEKVLAEFDEKRLYQATHCEDCRETIKSFLSQSLTESLKEFSAAIEVEKKHEGSKVSFYPLLDGTIWEISTYEEKQSFNAALQAIEEKRKIYFHGK